MKKGILSALVLTMALAPTAVGVNAHYDSTLKKAGIKTTLKEAEETKKIEVNFNVDSECATVDYDDKHFTTVDGVIKLQKTYDENESYPIPNVTAKEGWVFKGWKAEGADTLIFDAEATSFLAVGLVHFNGNTGYATFTAQFEKIEEPVVENLSAKVVIDLAKGVFKDYDGTSVLTNENLQEADYTLGFLPTVVADQAYKFVGWSVTNEANEVVATLDATATSYMFEYGASGEYTFTALFEEVVYPASADIVINGKEGYFVGYDGTTLLTNENLQDSDYTLGFLPEVVANEGYKWTGWTVKNEAGKELYNLDTAATEVSFPYGVGDHYIVKATFVKETPVEPEKPVNPKPEAKPENKPAKKPVTAWDNGGPFTTNAEGDVFDRWGNLIYDAPATSHSSNGYTMVNTSDR